MYSSLNLSILMSLSTYKPSLEQLRMISGIDEFKGAWRLLRTIAPERLSALRRIATIESIGSSTRIEGVKLTNAQVEALLQQVDLSQLVSRDEQEVAGYADLMDVIFASWESLALTENHIKQLHGILLKYSAKDERHRGNYKTIPNNVEAFDADGNRIGIVFETSSPFDTPFAMMELVRWTRTTLDERSVHPLIVIAIFVVTFLAIHPFHDGNGRLSRALTTLLLMRCGYHFVPYISLEATIELTKESYYLALRRTQASFNSDLPDWDAWIAYFLTILHTQMTQLERKVDTNDIGTSHLSELALEILTLATEFGRITTSDILKATGQKPGTVRNRINELCALGLLTRHGKARATWYVHGPKTQ